MDKTLNQTIKIGQTTIKINRLFVGKKTLEKLIEQEILNEK